jgi:hypothetical protein
MSKASIKVTLTTLADWIVHYHREDTFSVEEEEVRVDLDVTQLDRG